MKLRLLDGVGWPTLRVHRFVSATTLALSLVLGLPGCGPGTGGTGSGYPMNTAQSGHAAWALGSWSSVASSADSTNAAAPGCVSTAQAPCAPEAVRLDIAVSGINVDAGCWAFSYDGPWADSAGTLRVTGLYTASAAAGAVTTQTADLLIETRDTDVVLTVLDASGRVLQWPVTLMRSPGGAGTPSPSTGCAGQQVARGKG